MGLISQLIVKALGRTLADRDAGLCRGRVDVGSAMRRLRLIALRAKSAFAYHAIKWGLVLLVIAGIWAL